MSSPDKETKMESSASKKTTAGTGTPVGAGSKPKPKWRALRILRVILLALTGAAVALLLASYFSPWGHMQLQAAGVLPLDSWCSVSADGWIYTDIATSTDGFKIEGYQLRRGLTPHDLVIPATIDGKPVTEIATYFSNMVAGFGAVRSITLPASVLVVGHDAFASFYALEALHGGEGLVSIPFRAFGRSSPYYRAHVGKNLILGQNVLVHTVYDNLPATGPAPVSGTVTVPDGIRVIADGAIELANGSNDQGVVTEIRLPVGLERIKAWGLQNFEGSAISFPDGAVVEAGVFGISSQGALKDVWVGKNVTFELDDYYSSVLSIYGEPFTGTLHLPDGEVWGSTEGLFAPGSRYTVDCQRGSVDEAKMPEGVTVVYRD